MLGGNWWLVNGQRVQKETIENQGEDHGSENIGNNVPNNRNHDNVVGHILGFKKS